MTTPRDALAAALLTARSGGHIVPIHLRAEFGLPPLEEAEAEAVLSALAAEGWVLVPAAPDPAALLDELDRARAVVEAASVAVGTWLVPSAKKPDHPLAMARLHTALLVARDGDDRAYDRAVSKP